MRFFFPNWIYIVVNFYFINFKLIFNVKRSVSKYEYGLRFNIFFICDSGYYVNKKNNIKIRMKSFLFSS